MVRSATRGGGRRNSSGSVPGVGSTVRCAVYTRKSSEEGLEQEFNSLDAQREACEAYVLSQRHEGWLVLPEMYDDGGVSGGTIERPALQRLLADIRTKKIDTVVVYKVDRLTRSLSDFAKIVDVFDTNGVSFVSITQSFNTTTSMGRLTLNMLLSFAQFEREVTGERIRDKIAASKKKGMWMGGVTPLGYDVRDRKLVVNEAEAETVRHIFRRYAQLRSVRLLQRELAAGGIVSKRRVDRFGSERGGNRVQSGVEGGLAISVGARLDDPFDRRGLADFVDARLAELGGLHLTIAIDDVEMSRGVAVEGVESIREDPVARWFREGRRPPLLREPRQGP